MISGAASDGAEQSLRGVDLHLGYHGTPVVHGATITLRPGAVTALVGPNGSGKSTLLRAIARLHPISDGTVHFADGTAAAGLPAKEFARRVTLLAQSRPVPNGVTVRDVVGYGRHPYRGRWRTEDPDGPAAVARAMDVTGVAPMADRPVDELSGGELQRVWLATCLAQDTPVLLLDEPTTFLDLRYQVEILDLMRDLADDHGVAVGVVLHDLNQAAAVADEVVLLHGGRVRATGTPAEVFTEPDLTETYGIRIEVTVDPLSGLVTTRPVGRHLTRIPV
ncbi:ABC transporter ATP-binding protein [Micromonospora endophytica]|uniref:Fe(3+)-dicitrate ABC transporter ATP-binding protein n=1 Tax=Micromonospora endophytica TaxID=515350 RepID=A0A2W2CL32_9ACTN|nr:ABC transporter ATP-binding protein [Micromonospora endophytica]PZF92408.1 Fe(3+)-dicitrate ABC transporter ATP-binding protein [Micromonospora endophytica]RIW44799.1 ABC transporter ATP-binding protein [Micromonospora endophytica]BCJ57518.1 ABC transporter ATP-binding protein [Micromonospora endophytica]